MLSKKYFFSKTVLIILLIIILIAHTKYIGYSTIKIYCIVGPCPPIKNVSPIFYPFNYISPLNKGCGESCTMLYILTPRQNYNEYQLNMRIKTVILTIIYWYILAIIINLIYIRFIKKTQVLG